MELGQKIKQARLEAGLSQRQLCGQQITRNMLSQIENGSARPSIDTLRYLAGQLGKPLSYFWEEEAASANQKLVLQARQAWLQGDPLAALALLDGYTEADPIWDPEANLLGLVCCLDAAEKGDIPCLQKAAAYAAGTPYSHYGPERLCLLLQAKHDPKQIPQIVQQLPSMDDELLLRSQDALAAGDAQRCGKLLDAVSDQQSAPWQILRGDAAMAAGDYALARICYSAAEESAPHQVYPRLEECCRLLEDYKMAYHYACLQRN
jgi:transcriptional regulator with XRE-family HTH domain